MKRLKTSPLKTTKEEPLVRDHRIVLYIRTDEPKRRAEVLSVMQQMLKSHKRIVDLHAVSINTGLDALTVKEQTDATLNHTTRTTLGNLRCAGSLNPKLKTLLVKYKKLPNTVVVWIRGLDKELKCGLVKSSKTGKPIHYSIKEVYDDDVPF